MISIIMAPTDRPQIPVAESFQSEQQKQSDARLDLIDKEILSKVAYFEPVHMWSLTNFLTTSHGNIDRNSLREARHDIWRRIRRLKTLGLLHGYGRSRISVSKLPPKVRQKPSRKAVSSSRIQGRFNESTGSVAKTPSTPRPWISQSTVANRPLSPDSAPRRSMEAPGKTESAPSVEQLADAARTLAGLLRKKPKEFAGFFRNQPCRFGQMARTPLGEILPIVFAYYGRVFLDVDVPKGTPLSEVWPRITWRERQLQIVKHPAAVALGRLKRGKKERPSELKKMTARANGAKPCKPGKRRGRPRKTTGSGDSSMSL